MSIAREEYVAQLLDMGFPRNRAVKALLVTGNESVQIAMDWIFAHMDDVDIDQPYCEAENNGRGKESAGNSSANADLVLDSAKSTNDAAQSVRPLSKEEKEAELLKIQEKIAQRRKEKEEEEKRQEIEREKTRREMGKHATDAKQKYEESEARRIAEKIRREKEDEKAARLKIMAEIAKDKAERAARNSKIQQIEIINPTPSPSLSSTNITKDYATSKLQIRLPSGESVIQEFDATDKVSSVLKFVSSKLPTSNPALDSPHKIQTITLSTNFPRKSFGLSEADLTLSEAGWVPTSVLMVSRS
eukprot:Sdes_comp9267_c0_seq1m750